MKTTDNQAKTEKQGPGRTNPDVFNSDYPEWVVVENAGEDEEGIWSDHYTFRAAVKELKNAGGKENGFDIMKRLPNGQLTTEF